MENNNQNYQGQPNQGTNNYTYNNTYVNNYPDNRPVKSKIAAGILFILLGDIGIGNFYMGKIGLGILDIVFCWTGIPAIVNLIRGIIILCGSDESFENKYNVRVG